MGMRRRAWKSSVVDSLRGASRLIDGGSGQRRRPRVHRGPARRNLLDRHRGFVSKSSRIDQAAGAGSACPGRVKAASMFDTLHDGLEHGKSRHDRRPAVALADRAQPDPFCSGEPRLRQPARTNDRTAMDHTRVVQTLSERQAVPGHRRALKPGLRA